MSELRNVLERASTSLPPSERDFEALHQRRDRHRRRRRLTAGVVALLVAAAGTATAFTALGPDATEIGVGATRTYMDPVDGWTMEYPASWRLQVNDEPTIEYPARGAMVSNVDHEFRHPYVGPNSYSGAWDMRGLPGTLVLVEVHRATRGSFVFRENDSSEDHVDAGSMREEDLINNPYGPPGTVFSTHIQRDGRRFSISMFVGHAASPEDQEAARGVVSSLRFPGTEGSGQLCESPTYRPEYLPWESQEDRSEPQEILAKSGNRTLIWHGPDRKYFSIERHADVFGAGVDTDGKIRVLGYPAWFQWAEFDGIRELTESWAETEQPCRGYTLHLSLPGADAERHRSELQHIADGLRDPDRPPHDPNARLTFTPSSGAIGDRIEFEGDGFTDIRAAYSGYELVLQKDDNGCEALAETEHEILFDPDGHVSGWFIVPSEAYCFQGNPQGNRPVTPGVWTMILGAHPQHVGEFEVTA